MAYTIRRPDEVLGVFPDLGRRLGVGERTTSAFAVRRRVLGRRGFIAALRGVARLGESIRRATRGPGVVSSEPAGEPRLILSGECNHHAVGRLATGTYRECLAVPRACLARLSSTRISSYVVVG